VHGDHREQPRARAAAHEQRLVIEGGGVAVDGNGGQPGGVPPEADPAEPAVGSLPEAVSAPAVTVVSVAAVPLPLVGAASAVVLALGSPRGSIPSTP
jgi:hypothetical protein